jgi:hypothetical protein
MRLSRRSPDIGGSLHAKKIARRSLKGGAWMVLEDGWKVTPEAGGQIRVQLHNSEGVIVSLHTDVGLRSALRSSLAIRC